MSNTKKSLVTNFVRVAGVVENELEFCYKDKGESFYETTVAVPRKDGEKQDHIPVIVSKKIKKRNLKKDDKVYLRGEVRKYRIPDKDGNVTAKTGIFVFELVFLNEIKYSLNEVILEGTLAYEPYYKEVDGKKTTTLILDVPRRYEHSDYISVYAIEERAEILKEMQVRENIKIQGRIQSRYVPEKGMRFNEIFIKNSIEKSKKEKGVIK